MKYCTKCKTDKSVEEFSKSTQKKDGLQATCKQGVEKCQRKQRFIFPPM